MSRLPTQSLESLQAPFEASDSPTSPATGRGVTREEDRGEVEIEVAPAIVNTRESSSVNRLDAQTSHEPSLGGEIPGSIYGLMSALYAALLLVSWFAFGTTVTSDFTLTVATIIFAMIFAIIILARRIASGQNRAASRDGPALDDPSIDIATGALSAGEAYLQILLIPFALAVAAIALGSVHLIVN